MPRSIRSNIRLLITALAWGSTSFSLTCYGELLYFIHLKNNEDPSFLEPYNTYLEDHIILYPGCVLEPTTASKISCVKPSKPLGRILVDKATQHVESELSDTTLEVYAAAGGALVGAMFGFFTETKDNQRQSKIEQEKHLSNSPGVK